MTPSRIVFFGCLAFLAGVAVWNIQRSDTEESAPAPLQEVMFQARVAEDPILRPHGLQLVLEADVLGEQRVLVNAGRFEEYEYGDILGVSGRLRVPVVFDDFDYKDYLARQGISFVMYEPKIELVERGVYQGMRQRTYAVILKLKHRLRTVLHEYIQPPESTILGAIVLGDKSALDEETKEKLNASGLRHVTAISGMHVGLLTILLMRFLIWAGLWRQQAFYITIALMALFIVMTGLQASAVRAGIMGGMFLLGQHVGRVHVSMRALLFAAVLMLAINPLLLGDVGFQLSFFAVLGIVLFLPVFQYLLRGTPKKLQHVRDIAGMTISAQILTLPFLIFHFGYVSLVSLFTNVLVVPLLPFVLAFGFLFLIGGAVWGVLGFLLAIPVFFLLRSLTFVVDVSSQLPFAAVQAESPSVFWLVVFFLLLGLLYWKFRHRPEFPGSYL